MSIDTLKGMIPDSAKDSRINLSKVMTEAVPDLTPRQQWLIGLGSAYATQNQRVIAEILDGAMGFLDEADLRATQSAASLMAMNNIYYRFLYLVNDPEYSRFPVGLRMQVIGNPGIDKGEFELICLVISAINGCGRCVESHATTVGAHGVSKQAVQSAIRISSVINGVAQSIIL